MATNVIDSRPGEARPSPDDGIRVMLVDDSAIIRGLIARMITPEPGVTVVASVGDGAQAVKRLAQRDIDVIVLDIEMPVMDGLTALPKLVQLDPNVKIVMASTLTERNAAISIRALSAGAADYIPKPTSSANISGASEFRRELLEKIKTLGAQARRDAGRPLSREEEETTGTAAAASLYARPVELRKPVNAQPPQILAIGSSTGGPEALLKLFKRMKPTIGVPVVVTQHMPATFTRLLADHMTRTTEWDCTEAKDGEVLLANHVYVAPGDYHMEVTDGPDGPTVSVNQNPRENFCRPAVDPMFRSLAKVFGGRVLAAVLTGMGADGLKGGGAITEAGGTVVAQDEKTSIVWGMPGAVATAGLCSVVLPIGDLADYIMDFMGTGSR